MYTYFFLTGISIAGKLVTYLKKKNNCFQVKYWKEHYYVPSHQEKPNASPAPGKEEKP